MADVKKTVYITEEQNEWLRHKAFIERRNETEIIRELIQKEINGCIAKDEQP